MTSASHCTSLSLFPHPKKKRQLWRFKQDDVGKSFVTTETSWKNDTEAGLREVGWTRKGNRKLLLITFGWGGEKALTKYYPDPQALPRAYCAPGTTLGTETYTRDDLAVAGGGAGGSFLHSSRAHNTSVNAHIRRNPCLMEHWQDRL